MSSKQLLRFSEPTYTRLAIQLGEVVMAHAEATLAPVGLTPREYDTMLCIADTPDLSQLELSKILGLYAPRIVSLIDALESRNLVKRVASSKDRRKNVIHLTGEGYSLLSSTNERVAKLQETLFGSIPDKERRHFKMLVERIAAIPCPSVNGHLPASDESGG